jgi:hypothetical protein
VPALVLALAGFVGVADAGSGAPRGVPGLDRIAAGVDGVESSHGTNPAMWRPDPDGPQGPMQVSAAAAADVGGGNRFDLGENRVLGRAYLARLYRRFGSWPDALAAYNWGPGHMQAWVAGGRRASMLPLQVVRYQDEVLLGVVPGCCGSGRGGRLRRRGIVHRQPRAAAIGRALNHRLAHGALGALYAEAMRASAGAVR